LERSSCAPVRTLGVPEEAQLFSLQSNFFDFGLAHHKRELSKRVIRSGGHRLPTWSISFRWATSRDRAIFHSRTPTTDHTDGIFLCWQFFVLINMADSILQEEKEASLQNTFPGKQIESVTSRIKYLQPLFENLRVY
jgi:hypothetical protein